MKYQGKTGIEGSVIVALWLESFIITKALVVDEVKQENKVKIIITI